MVMRVKLFSVIFLTIIFLLSFNYVRSIGVGQPLPIGLKLLRGDKTRFFFTIFATGSSVKQSCTYSVSGLEPLVISFDEKEVIVEANGERKVYGTITVPQDAPIKNYEGTLFVSCKPIIEMGVSGSVIRQTMNVPFSLSVVEKPTERVAPPVTKEEKGLNLLLISSIIVVVIIVTIYWFSRKRLK